MNGNIDKDALYGNFQRHSDARNRLAMKAAHKALDIADDDMQINANKSGIGPMALVGTVLAATVAPSLLAGALLFKGPATPSTPVGPATTPPAAVPPRPDMVQDIEQQQDPATGQWKELWRGPARPKTSSDKVQAP